MIAKGCVASTPWGVPWQEAEAAAKKLRSSEKRKQQAYEAFTAQTLQDAQRCALNPSSCAQDA